MLFIFLVDPSVHLITFSRALKGNEIKSVDIILSYS